MDLLRQSSESLAGRISYIELCGLNILEVPADKPEEIHKLWLRGGFPESYLAQNNSHAMDWIENLIRTYLERDVLQMGFRVPAVRLRRLWTMLAHLQGEGANFSKLADNLEVDGKHDDAQMNFERSIEIYETLYPQNPKYVEVANGLARALNNLSNLLSSLDKKDEKQNMYKRSMEIRKTFYKHNPKNVEIKTGYAANLCIFETFDEAKPLVDEILCLLPGHDLANRLKKMIETKKHIVELAIEM